MCESCDPKLHTFRSGFELLNCDVCNQLESAHRERVRIRIGVGIPVDCCPTCGSSYRGRACRCLRSG